METSGDPTAADGATKRPGRFRRWTVGVLVVVGCVLAPLSLIALWTHNTLLDTDEYVSTVAPLARNQDIREAGATRITDRIVHSTDLEARLQNTLPSRAQAAVPAMTSALEQVIHDAALRILSSDQFASIWEQANRRVQPRVVAALTGDTSGAVGVNDGVVSVDLAPVAKRVRARVAALGFDVSANRVAKVPTTIELFRWPWLGTVQDAVDLLQQLAWVLPVVMLLCFAVAIAWSPNRRRTVLRTGLGVSAGMAVVLIGLNVGRGPYLDLFPRPEGRQAAGAAYDQLLHALRLEGRAVFVLGLVVAFGAWLAGPSPTAARWRAAFTRRPRAAAPSELSHWVGAHRVGLRVFVVALGVVVLVAFDTLSGWVVLGVALAVLLAIAVIELVGRSTSAPAASASP